MLCYCPINFEAYPLEGWLHMKDILHSIFRRVLLKKVDSASLMIVLLLLVFLHRLLVWSHVFAGNSLFPYCMSTGNCLHVPYSTVGAKRWVTVVPPAICCLVYNTSYLRSVPLGLFASTSKCLTYSWFFVSCALLSSSTSSLRLLYLCYSLIKLHTCIIGCLV